MYDAEAARRLAALEDKLAALANLEAVNPLRLDKVDGCGATLSIDESLLPVPAITYDEVVAITTGTLANGAYDATIEPRTAGAFTTGGKGAQRYSSFPRPLDFSCATVRESKNRQTIHTRLGRKIGPLSFFTCPISND